MRDGDSLRFRESRNAYADRNMSKRSAIADVCRRYVVARLEVFGSAARGTDFGPTGRDADFLVEFAPNAQVDLSGWFSVRIESERLLGRGVDLVEYPAVRNPYVSANIDRTRKLIYAE